MTKYRFGQTLSEEISLNRKKFRKLDTANAIARKRRNLERYTALKMEVESYFKRDNISRCMPGKNNAVKVQKRNKSEY